MASQNITSASPTLSQRIGWPQAQDQLPGADLPWLQSLRRDAANRLDTIGLPRRGMEHWKYTRLHPLTQFALTAPAAPRTDSTVTADKPDGVAAQLRIVEGRLQPFQVPKDLPSGLQIVSLHDAITSLPDVVRPLLERAALRTSIATGEGRLQDAFGTALLNDGYVILAGEDVQLEAPIHVTFTAADDSGSHGRHCMNFIVAGPKSRISVFEHHLSRSAAPALANTVTTVEAGTDANIALYRLQDDATDTVHLHTTAAELEAGAKFDSFLLSLGSKLSRHETEIYMNGPDAVGAFRAVYAKTGQQHCDITSIVDHKSSDTHSHQIVRGVLDQRAKAVFQGNITIRKDAQRVDGRQQSKALLLSDQAEVNTKPELRIHADDVKCSHGATTGTLDEDALFYLRTRGIPDSEARNMLVQAFVSELVDNIEDAQLRRIFSERLLEWPPDEPVGNSASSVNSDRTDAGAQTKA